MENQGRICPRGARYYTWQAGDTLQSIAQRNGTTLQAVQLLNPDVDFAAVSIGTEICIPTQSFTCVSGRAYSVRAGDTFTSIAEAYGISVYELSERNPGVNPEELMVGQVLCVPSRMNPDVPTQPDTPSLPTPSVPSTPPVIIQPTPACPTGYTRDFVRAGQTYADLLIRHNVSYRAMRAANPRLSPSLLIAGSYYCAPPAGMRQVCTGLNTYTVQQGETLATLARDLRITQGRLLALNPNLLPTDFTAGAVICIP